VRKSPDKTLSYNKPLAVIIVRLEKAREDICPFVGAVGMWESRRDFQTVWEGGKPALWLSMLSILCHFHGLLFRGSAGNIDFSQFVGTGITFWTYRE
jgi:hypothetical protein